MSTVINLIWGCQVKYILLLFWPKGARSRIRGQMESSIQRLDGNDQFQQNKHYFSEHLVWEIADMILLSSNCIGKYYLIGLDRFMFNTFKSVCFINEECSNYGLNVSGSVNHLVVPDSLRDPMDYTAHQAPMSMAFSSQEYWPAYFT